MQVARRNKRTLGFSEEQVWTPRRRWNRDTEGLYAAFIERLFDYPLEDDRTWTKLQELITDKDRNILYDYFGQKEDDDLASSRIVRTFPIF